MAFLIIYGFSEGFPGHWTLLERWISIGHKLWLISESPDQTRLNGVMRWDAMSRQAQQEPMALPWESEQWRRAAGADGVICLWEQSVTGAARLANRLGLPGPDPQSAQLARDKWLMVQRWQSAGIRVPFTQPIDSPESLTQLLKRFRKIVVKPTDSGGGFGVQEVTARWPQSDGAWDDLRTWRNVSLIAQERIDGPEVSVEGFVDHANRYHLLGVTAKYTTVGPRFVEVGHMAPAPIDDAKLEIIHRLANQCHDAFDLRDCVTHLEVKLSSAGPIPIELGARVAGGAIPEIWASTDRFDLYEVARCLATGKLPVVQHSVAHAYAAVVFPTVRANWQEIVSGMDLELLDSRCRNGPTGRAISDNSSRWQLIRVRGGGPDMVLKFIREVFRSETGTGALGVEVVGIGFSGGVQ